MSTVNSTLYTLFPAQGMSAKRTAPYKIPVFRTTCNVTNVDSTLSIQRIQRNDRILIVLDIVEFT